MIPVHAFVPRSRANGPGERTVLWVQGCPRQCAGCWNQDSLAFDGRNLASVDSLLVRILAVRGITGVTFSGGEPFSHAEDLAELARRLKAMRPELTLVCFSGHTLEQIRAAAVRQKSWGDLLAQIDLLVDGDYRQELQCNEPLKGSSNQRLHFLSDRIRPEEVTPSIAEFTLGSDGTVLATGFPTLLGTDAVFRELASILPRRETRQ